MPRAWRAVIAGVVVVILAGAIGAFALGGSSKAKTAGPKAVVATTTTTKPKPKVVQVARCPLTNVAAPGGVVPRRPAVLVKIGNEPGPARPQSGLNEADVVIDTPAEGFIMRYIGVYQCGPATMIGPLRSVRWVDYHLSPQFGRPILAYAGGITPNVQAVQGSSNLLSADMLAGQASASWRTTNRYPPDNLYTSTSALYGLFPGSSTPPRPIFHFTPRLPAGAAPLQSAALDFSGGTDVVWVWQPASHSWLHTYSGVPDVDALTGKPVTATNVVVQIVNYAFGPFPESVGGSGDVESNTLGTGSGYVLRDGRYIPVVWHRASQSAPATFTTINGRPVGLAAGRTWIELMTNTQAAGGIHFLP
jgi:hypothetical protein